MKGIILAGGSGTRLYPITSIINKILIPIYNKPMINYPLSTLILAGIKDILIISSREHIENFKKYLKDGKEFGCNFEYKVQEKPNGIAEAFEIAEEFLNGESCCLILGDNLFYGESLENILINAKNKVENFGGGVILAYKVKDPRRYGVVEFDKNQNVLSIEEKPKIPKSDFAIPGIYFFDNTAIEISKKVSFSARGEKEITDVQKEYLKNNKLSVEIVGKGVAWLDTGTFNSMLEASNFVRSIEESFDIMVGCVEEEAYKKGFMNKEMLLAAAEKSLKSGYGEYLLKLLK